MGADYLVSVLLPTRGRPELMLKSVSSIIKNARHPEQVQILLKIDNDDKDTYMDCYPELEKLTSHYKVLYSPRGLGYGEYLFLWNDDAKLVTPNWDEIINEYREGLHGSPMAVIQIDDKHGWKFGFPFVHREIYNAMGHFSLNAHNDTWMHYVAHDAGIERIELRKQDTLIIKNLMNKM